MTNLWNSNKPDCRDCNRPPFEAWATPHDPYGHNPMPLCTPCNEARIAEQIEWHEEMERKETTR